MTSTGQYNKNQKKLGGNKMSEIKKYIFKALEGQDLTFEEAARATQIIASNGATPVQIASLISALKVKGETFDELNGVIEAIRAKLKINLGKIENSYSITSTGSYHNLKNITLPVQQKLALAGQKVVGFGRPTLLRNSDADILEELNYDFPQTKDDILKRLEEEKYCFVLEDYYSPKIYDLHFVAQEIGVLNIFDIASPFLSPFIADYYFIGTGNRKYHKIFSRLLVEMKVKAAFIVTSEDNLDGISPICKTFITKVKGTEVSEFVFEPNLNYQNYDGLYSGMENKRGDDDAESFAAYMSNMLDEDDIYKNTIEITLNLIKSI